jgi:hypothetical protein
LRLKGESRQQINCPKYRSMNRSSADSFTGRRIRGASKEARHYVFVGAVARSENDCPRQANCRGQKAEQFEFLTMSSKRVFAFLLSTRTRCCCSICLHASSRQCGFIETKIGKRRRAQSTIRDCLILNTARPQSGQSRQLRRAAEGEVYQRR